MDDHWKQLCACLEDELERQQTVMAVCQAQREAVRARDLPRLEAKTDALDALIHEATVAEKTRIGLLRSLTNFFELPAERQTLSELVRLAPEPWGRRLAELQKHLQALLPQIRGILNDTQERLSLGQSALDRTLYTLLPNDAPPPYGGRGTERAARTTTPVLIDSRG
jgi:hypothetical protein